MNEEKPKQIEKIIKKALEEADAEQARIAAEIDAFNKETEKELEKDFIKKLKEKGIPAEEEKAMLEEFKKSFKEAEENRKRGILNNKNLKIYDTLEKIDLIFINSEAEILKETIPIFKTSQTKKQKEKLMQYLKNKEKMLPSLLEEYFKKFYLYRLEELKKEALKIEGEKAKEQAKELEEYLKETIEEEKKLFTGNFLLSYKTIKKDKNNFSIEYLKQLMQAIGIQQEGLETYKPKYPSSYEYSDNLINKQLNSIFYNTPEEINLLHNGKLDITLLSPKGETEGMQKNNLQNLGAFNCFVLEAANTLSKSNKFITTEMIFNYQNGTETKAGHIPKVYREKVEEALFLLSTKKIKITPKEAFKLKGERVKEIIELEPYLLPMQRAKVKAANNKIIDVYEFLEQPPLAALNIQLKQFKTIEPQYLKPLGNNASITPERSLIINAIGKRINAIKDARKKNEAKSNTVYKNQNKINYETFFEETTEILNKADRGSSNYKKQKSRYIEFIKETLTTYKKENLIKNFKEYPAEKKRKAGIEIVL